MFRLEDVVEVINIKNLNMQMDDNYLNLIGQQGKIIAIDEDSNTNKPRYIVNIPITNKYIYMLNTCIMDNRMIFAEENLKLVG